MDETSTTLAYNFVREGILSGRFQAGAHLRETELATALGSSRTPIREALRLLDAEGLVEITPHRGARVCSWSHDEIRETYALRLLLEGEAARRAAALIKSDALSQLSLFATEMKQALQSGSPDRFATVAELNNRFHRVIHQSSGDSLLSSTLSSIIMASMVKNTFSIYTAVELSRSMNHHQELITALEHRDGDWAEAVMRCHIQAARWVTKPRPLELSLNVHQEVQLSPHTTTPSFPSEGNQIPRRGGSQ